MHGELAKLKIEALLHDPPGKAPTLWYRSHDRFSTELVRAVLGEEPRHDQVVKLADRYASAVDRIIPRDSTESRADFLRDPQIIHPLSASRYDLRSLAGLDLDRIEREQREVVEALVERAGGQGGDPERLYWWLWRGLGAELARRGDVGKLWTYLPADTRIPDHSIWDHMRLTSAFAGALGMERDRPALLLFSFGPVQSLIAAARRTGDLWAGSFLLSWLAWRAMRGLVAECGADAVLFPDLYGQSLVDAWLRDAQSLARAEWLVSPSRMASLPNRFLALVPADEGERLARRCEQALREASAEFVEGRVAEFADERSVSPARRAEWGSTAAKQVHQTLACQWHVLPWAGEEESLEELSRRVLGSAIDQFWRTRQMLEGAELYRPNLGTFFAVQHGLVEAGHGAAKTLRRFTQIDEAGGRCTVCGVREALWDSRDPITTGRGLRAGERLCGLCAARRHAPKSEWAREVAGREVIFPSTHNLAAARFLEGVLDCLAKVDRGEASEEEAAVADRAQKFLEPLNGVDRAYATPALMRRARECGRYREAAEDLVKLPAELLLPETFEPVRGRTARPDELDELGVRGPVRQRMRESLRVLRDAGAKAGLPAPGRYYAVVVMDGDEMRKWLSGALAPLIGEVLHEHARPREDPPYLRERRPLSSAHQVAVSRALNQFSLEVVGPLVEDVHGGVVVYAGGDDLLAMLPLHTLLPCLRDLRRLYSGLELPEESAARAEGFEASRGHVWRRGVLWRVMGDKASCSIGVAIAHQKWPLRHALETAREMEQQAKRALKRNAVVVALLKRSGGHEWFGARWGPEHQVDRPDPIEVLEGVASVIQSGMVSRRFVYALREEVLTLWPLKEALAERVHWLIRHHARSRPKLSDAEKARVDRVARDLCGFAQGLDRAGAAGEHGEFPMERFVAGLGIAEFIARGGGGEG